MSIHCANRVWEHSTQKDNALLLLLALADCADEHGFAFPGQETLTAQTRLSVRQAPATWPPSRPPAGEGSIIVSG
jgi:hypothetical protein